MDHFHGNGHELVTVFLLSKAGKFKQQPQPDGHKLLRPSSDAKLFMSRT